VIAAPSGMLLVAAVSILAAFGALAHGQPSSQRVEVTAVFGLLAPLFWPGRAATPGRTALRVVAWSAVVAASAAIVLAVLAPSPQPWARGALACAMLMAILVLTHAAGAVLEQRWQVRSDDGDGGRELAGQAMASALAALGTMPFWLGPVTESLSVRHPGIIDIVVGLSPLTHLAVASGNDLLRGPWLYGHSNLAVLPVAYPDLATLAWGYGSACALLAIVALASRRPRRSLDATPIESTSGRTA
jgi:hypothetical protein